MFSRIVALILLVVFFAPGALAGGREIVVSVDDEKVTVDEILYLLGVQSGGGDAIGPLIAKQMTPEETGAFLEKVARALLFSKGAILRGLHLDPGVSARVRWSRINLLAEAYVGSVSSLRSFDEKSLRAHYEQHRDSFQLEEKVRIRQIFTFEEEAATSALLRLLSGEDFAGVAVYSSMDFATAEKGGDMGWIGRGVLPSELEDAFFSSPVGTIRGPLVSKYGYHVYEVTGRQDARSLSFDEARDMVRADLAERTMTAESDSLASRFQVRIDPSVLERALSR